MNTFTISLAVLSVLIMNVHAGIPNGGFEAWTTQEGIEVPSAPWITNNLQNKPDGVNYNPVTKSSDHYPVNAGSYSIRLENNITYLSEPGEPLPYWACSYGFTTTAFYPGYTGPVFPVSGHPDTLWGYYKFMPQNHDTMSVSVGLYFQGTLVSFASFQDTSTMSEWASFCIPIPEYSVADSAQIGMTAFYFGLEDELPKGPYGNSILYIDNLSFDELINTAVDDEHGTVPARPELGQNYPNPFNPSTTIEYSILKSSYVEVSVYNLAGRKLETLVETNRNPGNYSVLWDGSNYASGVYIYQIRANDHVQSKKMLLIK